MIGAMAHEERSRAAAGAPPGPVAIGADAPPPARRSPPLAPWRQRLGWAIPLVGLPLLTAGLQLRRDQIDLASALLLYLLVVVSSAAVAGTAPAVTSAVAALALANWYFAQPVHTLRMEEPHNLLAAIVFLVVAVVVSRFMTTASHRSSQAENLARTDEVRSALLQAVSHDLRTPLAGIKASASSLRQHDVTWPPSQIEEFLATIEHETDRLTSLVDNLLDMSRIQTGALPVSMGRVGLEEIVPAALAHLGCRARGVEVDLPETLPEVRADPVLLERVVANLVDNAVAHTDGVPAGPGPPAVRVEARPDRGRVVLRVVDRGPGIDPADRERVFRPFQRQGDGHRSAGAGVGLGLAVARGFARAMGGDVHIETTAGGGATLAVELAPAPPRPGGWERA